MVGVDDADRLYPGRGITRGGSSTSIAMPAMLCFFRSRAMFVRGRGGVFHCIVSRFEYPVMRVIADVFVVYAYSRRSFAGWFASDMRSMHARWSRMFSRRRAIHRRRR